MERLILRNVNTVKDLEQMLLLLSDATSMQSIFALAQGSREDAVEILRPYVEKLFEFVAAKASELGGSVFLKIGSHVFIVRPSGAVNFVPNTALQSDETPVPLKTGHIKNCIGVLLMPATNGCMPFGLSVGTLRQLEP